MNTQTEEFVTMCLSILEQERSEKTIMYKHLLLNFLREKRYRYEVIYNKNNEDSGTGWVIHPEYYDQWIRQPEANYPKWAVFLHP